jgi:uncharacterized membrane protein
MIDAPSSKPAIGTKPALQNETARVEAFSDGVFAIAITLLILEIHVPPAKADLMSALMDLWPSYLAFVASFMTIGVMWLNHHRLFTLINKNNDGLILLNLLLLLGVTWIPFPTAVLAEHLTGRDQRDAGILYAASFFVIAIVFNVMWRFAVRSRAVLEHVDVPAISRQYMMGPVFYAALVVLSFASAVWCLVTSALIALYFALPPSLWRRKHSRAGAT